MMPPKPRAYILRGLSTDINCSSSGHHSTDLYCSYRDKRCSGWDYDIDTDSIWGTRQPDIVVPKYFRTAIRRELLTILKSGGYRVFEYDRDKNKRYTDLRYHEDGWAVHTIAWLERAVGE